VEDGLRMEVGPLRVELARDVQDRSHELIPRMARLGL
jgi:hypothetical protein